MENYSHNGQKLIIVHDIPGRVRVRSSFLKLPELQEEMLEAYLLKIADISDIRLNRPIGSLAVRYKPGESARIAILESLCCLTDEFFAGVGSCESKPDPINIFISIGLTLIGKVIPMPLRPVYTWLCNAAYITEGINVLLTKGLKVEVLDAVTLSVLTMQHRYFTAGAVRTLLNVGEYVETSMNYRSTSLLKSLLQPTTEKVWVEKNGVELEVPFNELRLHDTLVMGTGELVPVDGQVIAGEAMLNQAAITGESLPVHAMPGFKLLAGSVITEGRLKIDVQTIGSEVSTARISSFIKDSLVHKSKSHKEAERLADRLVPVTFATGAGVYLFTRNLEKTAAVFAVDYSCALKLVCPTAQKAAMYAIAQKGVLVRGASALDALGQIDTLVFDKTGTLTTGKLSISQIIPYNGLSEETLLGIAAAAEEHYLHPIAKAVVAEARCRSIEIPFTSEVDFIVAHGVSAFVNDLPVRIGSLHFIEADEGVDCSDSYDDADSLRMEGNTILYIAQEDKLIGIIALSDTLRSEAYDCIRCFRELGIKRMVMLTGDNEVTAKTIGKRLGVEVRWELKPQQKAEIVEHLKDEGCSIAFLGDGVNDAPALVAADVGIAMPDAADIAREAAEVVLMRDNLIVLAYALALAKNAQKKISNGVNFSIAVNSGTMLLSILGYFSPLTSAVFHNGATIASLLYVLNGANSDSSIKKLLKENDIDYEYV